MKVADMFALKISWASLKQYAYRYVICLATPEML
jgi:hypothetical protein